MVNSNFYGTQMAKDINAIIAELQRNLDARKNTDATKSYVKSLYDEGDAKICRKICEEATEVTIAALSETDERIISESADLFFHMTVLLAHRNIPLTALFAETESRLNISGLDEKAKRTALAKAEKELRKEG